MNIPKNILGWWFFLTGFVGGALVGYMQITQNPMMWYYSFVYISFLGSWYALFDYTKRLEDKHSN
jgi:hypothetical protein